MSGISPLLAHRNQPAVYNFYPFQFFWPSDNILPQKNHWCLGIWWWIINFFGNLNMHYTQKLLKIVFYSSNLQIDLHLQQTTYFSLFFFFPTLSGNFFSIFLYLGASNVIVSDCHWHSALEYTVSLTVFIRCLISAYANCLKMWADP